MQSQTVWLPRLYASIQAVYPDTDGIPCRLKAWGLLIPYRGLLNGFAFSTELGREEFEGKLDGEPIKFDTQYTFWATWPSGSCPKPADEKEITGGCIHYVSGADVGGVIRFYDVMPTVGKGATHFFYEGFLTRG